MRDPRAHLNADAILAKCGAMARAVEGLLKRVPLHKAALHAHALVATPWPFSANVLFSAQPAAANPDLNTILSLYIQQASSFFAAANRLGVGSSRHTNDAQKRSGRYRGVGHPQFTSLSICSCCL